MAPLAATDQPWGTDGPFLPALDPAGTVSIQSPPGPCWRRGPVARTGTPAGGSAVSSTWPACADAAAPVAPAVNATGPEPLPSAGGQARAAEVTATCRVTAEESGPGAAGWASCAAP